MSDNLHDSEEWAKFWRGFGYEHDAYLPNLIRLVQGELLDVIKDLVWSDHDEQGFEKWSIHPSATRDEIMAACERRSIRYEFDKLVAKLIDQR